MFQSNMRHQEYMLGGEEQSPPHYPHHLELEPKPEYGEPESQQQYHHSHVHVEDIKDTTNIGGYDVNKSECRVKVEPDSQGYLSLPPFTNWLERGLCPSRGKYWGWGTRGQRTYVIYWLS